ncbi:MAG: hypothetical protein ACRDYW_10820, partial [Acidimicrobiales bacterium]
VFEPATREFLESGCALIVGSVAADGEPHASRGWGLDVLGGDPPLVRLLLDAGDVVALEHAAAGGRLAVTAASVRTLRSTQLKGTSLGLEAVTPETAERAQRYVDQFFTDIGETDGTAREVLARLVPAGYVACTIQVVDRFDQTPGPAAGAPIGSGR